MTGLELTKNSYEGKPVWIPLDSIALVQPYTGFDNKECGTDIVLSNNGGVHVKESYVTVVEKLNGGE